MTDETDENGNLLPDEMRMTSFGRTLRSTSLDELPSLLNILMGDMSIIGPRALPVRYIPYYTEEEHHSHRSEFKDLKFFFMESCSFLFE